MRDMSSRSISATRQSSGATRRERLLRDRSTPAGTQAAFTQIARAIVGRSSASEVAQVVVEEVRRLVPSDRSAVWFWQPERDSMQLLAVAASPSIGRLAVGEIVRVNQGPIRAVLEQAHSVREADLSLSLQEVEQRAGAW